MTNFGANIIFMMTNLIEKQDERTTSIFTLSEIKVIYSQGISNIRSQLHLLHQMIMLCQIPPIVAQVKVTGSNEGHLLK